MGSYILLRCPPPPFDCDFTRDERKRTNMNEDWLPDVRDVLYGNFDILTDWTGDSDSQVS